MTIFNTLLLNCFLLPLFDSSRPVPGPCFNPSLLSLSPLASCDRTEYNIHTSGQK